MKSWILYIVMLIYLLIDSFIISPLNISFYNEIINPFMWAGLCGFALFLSRDSGLRIKDETNKTQSLVIALIIYLIIYYLLGLLFGFTKTPYSKDLLSILRNLWSFGSVVVFQEIFRHSMIQIGKKQKINYVVIALMFILANLSISGFMDNFGNVKDGFIYVVTVLIPLIVTSAMLTYLSYIGGSRLPIIYRLFLFIPEFVLPIIPSFDWFVTAIVGILLPVAIFVYLNFIHIRKANRLSRRARRNGNPIIYVPVFAFIAILAGFVIGLFKYQPIAVLSGSMSPTFNRGDAVVVEKLTKAEKDDLDVDDVIQFTSGSKYVVHRIIEVSNDEYGNRVFITKGDHNNTKDAGTVNYENIIGKVSFVIPYIGYPSVWLSGMIS